MTVRSKPRIFGEAISGADIMVIKYDIDSARRSRHFERRVTALLCALKSLPKWAGRRVVQSIFVIPFLVGISSVSCAIVGLPLELEAAPGLKVERVEDHGVKVFLISGHSGDSAYAVLGARVKTKGGVAHVVVTQVLVTSLRRDGRFSVTVPDNGTVKKIVFGRQERQIWSAGT